MPISAILFGGRRRTTVPLVTEAYDWEHGVFLGSIMASETTAAQAGAVGKLRFDPMAMLPFCGYNFADYFAHWLSIGKSTDTANLPKIFFVNWFRRDEDGRFLWPGFGENSRVLKWVFERVNGDADAVETPIGLLPTPDALDTDGLEIADDDLETLLEVDTAGWREAIPQIREHYAQFGSDLPGVADRRPRHPRRPTGLNTTNGPPALTSSRSGPAGRVASAAWRSGQSLGTCDDDELVVVGAGPGCGRRSGSCCRSRAAAGVSDRIRSASIDSHVTRNGSPRPTSPVVDRRQRHAGRGRGSPPGRRPRVLATAPSAPVVAQVDLVDACGTWRRAAAAVALDHAAAGGGRAPGRRRRSGRRRRRR